MITEIPGKDSELLYNHPRWEWPLRAQAEDMSRERGKGEAFSSFFPQQRGALVWQINILVKAAILWRQKKKQWISLNLRDHELLCVYITTQNWQKSVDSTRVAFASCYTSRFQFHQLLHKRFSNLRLNKAVSEGRVACLPIRSSVVWSATPLVSCSSIIGQDAEPYSSPVCIHWTPSSWVLR